MKRGVVENPTEEAEEISIQLSRKRERAGINGDLNELGGIQ